VNGRAETRLPLQAHSITPGIVRRIVVGGTLPAFPLKEIRMSYVDGFVAAVPTANREKFLRHAQYGAAVLKENGALQVVECWGDDVPEGKLTSFPMAVQRKDDETVIFSWIVWPSKAVRDEGMKKFMADPRMQPETNPMPFDGKRIIFGGFEVIVDV
jgi:uncharacterized protein YbaA (DUF1428 family)